MPASSQMLGSRMPRCGSFAMIAAPVALIPGATARLLLPDRLNPPSNVRRCAAFSPAPKLVAEDDPLSISRAHSAGQSSRARAVPAGPATPAS